MFFLVLLYPFAELYVFIEVIERFGIVNTLFALVASAVLGVGIVRAQGFFLIRGLQATVSRGEVPDERILQSVLVFAGGILFAIPGFISDMIGLLFILPGSRHLIAHWLKRKITQNIQKGNFHIFTGGAGFSTRGPFQSNESFRDVTPRELDASHTVIDVTPISESSKPKN